MPGFDGTGPRGMGSMTGGGRGYCVTGAGGSTLRRDVIPPYTYPRRRCWGGMPYRWIKPWATPYEQTMTREQEINFIKREAEAVKGKLEQLETRIIEIEAEES